MYIRTSFIVNCVWSLAAVTWLHHSMEKTMNMQATNGPLNTRQRVALVLGATGGFGGAVVAALAANGWRVRALHRDPSRARALRAESIDWIAGDATSAADVAAAAAGAQLIVHGVNPPGYRHWEKIAIPMLQNTIDAAARSGARIVFPGNVYNFGRDAGTLVAEDAPQHPATRKGAVRVRMEQMLKAAAQRGVRTLIVRAGDFFGPGSASSWFGAVMVKAGRPPAAVQYPGDFGVGHAWAYLPDLAQAVARLAESDRLADFEVLHFGGHWLEPGVKMAEAIRRVVERPDLPIRRFPWRLVRLASPFVPFFRELAEMR
ncbi:MAG TPA: SDR family NAD(P)-dependent oxidoreductase, partial [Burkholderiaceae bacterium]|nr:SDR family NAD(P)-dependent oxidoreductase [Burkholderiaceae bacterium]